MITFSSPIISARQVHLFVPVSAYLAGEITDWPANIQDGIYKAIERKQAEEREQLSIIKSECEWEEDEGYFLVHVILHGEVKSEVVLNS